MLSFGILDVELDVVDGSVVTIVVLDFIRDGSGCGDRGRGFVTGNVREG